MWGARRRDATSWDSSSPPRHHALVLEQRAPELPPQDAQRRFQLVVRRFIGVFAQSDHPLTLFLDDLQWLDAATLNLLDDLLTQAAVPPLLLICPYRAKQIDSSPPPMRKPEP